MRFMFYKQHGNRTEDIWRYLEVGLNVNIVGRKTFKRSIRHFFKNCSWREMMCAGKENPIRKIIFNTYRRDTTMRVKELPDRLSLALFHFFSFLVNLRLLKA